MKILQHRFVSFSKNRDALPSQPPNRKSTIFPTLTFGFGLLVFVVGCGVGLLLSSAFIDTPQQAQEQRQAPDLSAPTTTVTWQPVQQVERASCAVDRPLIEVSAPPSKEGKPNVVTSLDVEASQDLSGGELLASISGQPIVAFETVVPFYRDLAEGDSGEDVKALESNLVEQNLLPIPDTTFDSGTTAALQQLYSNLGINLTGFPLSAIQSVPPDSVVSKIAGEVGKVLEDDELILTIVEGTPSVACQFTPGSRVSDGDPGSLTLGADEYPGRLGALGEPSSDEGGMLVVSFIPDEPLAADQTFSGEVAVPVNGDEGEVLAVPIGAIFESSSGELELRHSKDGTTTSYTVSVGVVANGYAQVSGEGLTEGLEVDLNHVAVNQPELNQSDLDQVGSR